jgi:integrase
MARGHIRKRGSRWCVVVYMPPDGDGKRRYKWHSGFETKDEAQRALTEILYSLQTHSHVEPSEDTLATYLHRWLEGERVQLRPSTWTSYHMNLERHIIPRLGGTPLRDLTAAALNSLYAELLEKGRVDGKGGLSFRSVRYIHTILHEALADAVREDRVDRNVADQARPPRGHSGSGMRTWSAEELRAFLKHVRDDRLYAAWLLAATTGMRRGEVLGLRWRDVDLGTKRVAVTQGLVAVEGDLLFLPPKSDRGRRNIALDNVTVAALKVRRMAQIKERLVWRRAYLDNDLVFNHEEGSPLHPDWFSKQFETHVHAAGLPPIRLHDLRHTHATLALAAGVHPKVVQERLGHSSISVTLDTYSHAIPALQEEAAAKVSRLLFGD